MDHQTLINFVGTILIGGIGWWCRKIWESIDKLHHDIHQIELDLPQHYQRKDELETRFDKLDKRFDKLDSHIEKLFDRIDHK